MKTILLSATIMFLSYSCTIQDVETEQRTVSTAANKILGEEFPGEITAVYFQVWIAGVRGGGSGTDFYIELGQPLPDGVVLSHVYFRNKRAPITMISKTLYEVRFKNDINTDTENVSVSKSKNETKANMANSLLAADMQAELVYYEGDVLKSYLLTNLKEIPPLMYP